MASRVKKRAFLCHSTQNPKQTSQTNKLGIKWISRYQPQTTGVVCILQNSRDSSMIDEIGEKLPKMKEEPLHASYCNRLKMLTI